MDEINICPVCHINVRPTDYFCFNCGTNLRPAPLSTSFETQVKLYLKCLFLPPMGMIWGLRYLKQKDSRSKAVGYICIIITTVLLFLLVKWTKDLIDTVNDTVNTSMDAFYGF